MQSSHGEVYKVSVSGVPPEPDQGIVLLYPEALYETCYV